MKLEFSSPEAAYPIIETLKADIRLVQSRQELELSEAVERVSRIEGDCGTATLSMVNEAAFQTAFEETYWELRQMLIIEAEMRMETRTLLARHGVTDHPKFAAN